DIYVTTRPDRASPWSAPVRVAELSSTADDAGPALGPGELTLYFSSDRGGDFDLYVSVRASKSEPWGEPVAVAELASAATESEPWVNETGTLIVFGSRRPGGQGGTDLYAAERASPDQPFGPPAPIVELNTALNDTDPWLSPDARTIFFTRDDALYTASR